MLIKEVILKNFMSYEYARIPLKKGVNVVCGPNGSGKSSFLLGICVALGDTYTERSKRLSDLIRWNQEQAEVSLILDNSPRSNNIRPVANFNMDEVRLTRNIRRDGKYGFELNQRTVPKAEVTELLRSFGFDPDNMLIIMHQNMPGRFANLSPQDRLIMLEEAVGFNTFRKDVVEAKQKLSGILSEEQSLNQLLDRARETLQYWREQNERLQEKKQYQTRMLFLQRELAWSKVLGLEKLLKELEEGLDKADSELYKAEEEMNQYAKVVIDSENYIKRLRTEWLEIIEQRIESEKTVGVSEYSISITNERIKILENMINYNNEQKKRFEEAAFLYKEQFDKGPTRLDDYFKLFNDLETSQGIVYENLKTDLENQKKELESKINNLSNKLGESENKLTEILENFEIYNAKLDAANNQYIDGKIQLALLKDKRGRLKRQIDSLKTEIDRTSKEERDAEAEAIIKGQRVETGRLNEEILNEIRKTSGILVTLSEVPEDSEEMYSSYNKTYKEIQEKVVKVQEDRRQVMTEIDERTKKWNEVIRNLLDEVNSRYQSLLSRLQARGEVRLLNSVDIEEAGLEIFVSFKGGQLSKLDPYTHSGGERSTSVMAFLLALQQNVLSPFRAVDEFDLHMDPRNKEVVSEFIVNTMEDTLDQYMAITPSQITFRGKNVHIIMIHKTDDKSEVKLIEES